MSEYFVHHIHRGSHRQHLILRQTTVLVFVIPFQTVFTEPLVGNRRSHVVGPDERRQQRIGLFVVVGTAGQAHRQCEKTRQQDTSLFHGRAI